MDTATTARQRTTHPMSYYWSMVKDMDDTITVVDACHAQNMK